LEYRPSPGGRGVAKKRLTLGRYGAMAAEEARAAALDAMARIRLGRDPAAEKARQRASLTGSGLIDAFIEGHAAKLKPKSAESYEGALAKLQAAYGGLKAEAITRGQIARLHTSLSATPYAANRMLAAVSSLYAWAESHGLLPEGHGNPARKITRYREQGRERFLTTDELARLGDALQEGETIGLPYSVDETKPKAKQRGEGREPAGQARSVRGRSDPPLDPDRGSPSRNSWRRMATRRPRTRRDLPA
jgi:hypothetical protein